jgi:mannose-1-phosphate guanylyltransferase
VAVIQGMKDYIIVDSEDVLLIVKKDDEQNIKHYLDDVRKATGDKFL